MLNLQKTNRMVIDCFTFFNELDLLEIRLNELNQVVDKFVLVEATRTHQFKEKPLYYQQNKERFSAFHHKIIHVIVDQYPDNPNNEPWVYERYQRNMIKKGLEGLNADDIIMVSDLDEIPRAEKVKQALTNKGMSIFVQDCYYYFINCINNSARNNEEPYRWTGTVMAKKSIVDRFSPQFLRDVSIHALTADHPQFIHRALWNWWKFRKLTLKGVPVHFMPNGGWHFSYLGGVERIIAKIESFAHSEFNKPEFKVPEKIEKAIRSGEDIFGRGFTYQFVDVDDKYPDYILKNREKFSTLIMNK